MNFLRSIWSRYKLPIKLALVAAIVVVLATRMDWATVTKLISEIQIQYFLIAILFVALQVIMLAVRWDYFMNAEQKLVNYKTALNMSVASQLANFIFITSVGGVFLRLFLARHYGLSILKSVCAVVGDRMMTLFAMVFFAVVLFPVLTDLIPGDKIKSSFLELVLALAFCVFAGLAALKFLLPVIRKNDALYSSLLYLKQILKKPQLALRILLSSLMAQGFFFLSVWMAALAINIQVDFIKFMALLPFISIASSLPIGFGGWGIREGSFVVALGFLHVPMESAFMISVQVGILSILGTLLVAVPLVFTSDFQKLLKLAKSSLRKTSGTDL